MRCCCCCCKWLLKRTSRDLCGSVVHAIQVCSDTSQTLDHRTRRWHTYSVLNSSYPRNLLRTLDAQQHRTSVLKPVYSNTVRADHHYYVTNADANAYRTSSAFTLTSSCVKSMQLNDLTASQWISLFTKNNNKSTVNRPNVYVYFFAPRLW